jgi:riboflavin synthase
MFNGIIEHTGVVHSLTLHDAGGARLVIDAGKLAARVKEGDSIAVDGVCLTVVKRTRQFLYVDISPETWRLTTFSYIKRGSQLNLELPISVSATINGHFVQGHVEGRAKVNAYSRDGKDVRLALELPEHLADYCIPKGSIAINGVSLTIASMRGRTVTIALIPYTLKLTNLGRLKKGDVVNIETGMIGRYVVTTLKKEYHNVKSKK